MENQTSLSKQSKSFDKYRINTLGTETFKPINPTKVTNYSREQLLQTLCSDIDKTIQKYLSFEQIKNNTELKDLVEVLGNELKTDMIETSKKFGKLIICVDDNENEIKTLNHGS